MINTIQIALSGMMASTKRVETSAANIAHMTTTGSLHDGDKAPYSAQTTVQETLGDGNGVKATATAKNTPFVPAYAPDSPFADENGLVGLSNVNMAEEAVMMKLAEHTYKSNIATIRTASAMQDELLRALDKKA